MKIKDICVFHFVSGCFLLLMGYIICAALNIEVEYQKNIIENAGFSAIFLNNIVFFTLICILPFVGYAIGGYQFLTLGTYIYLCKDMTFVQQFNILYRHAIFEIIAILLSAYISYSLYNLIKRYIKSIKKGDKSYSIEFRKIAFVYFVVVVSTAVGALLEGYVHV